MVYGFRLRDSGLFKVKGLGFGEFGASERMSLLAGLYKFAMQGLCF